MFRRICNLVPLAVPILLAGCFFLPNAVSAFTDAKKFDNLVVFEAHSISFEQESTLGLPERLALTASSNTESLVLKNGRFLDMESAAQSAAEKLSLFFGTSSFGFDSGSFSVDECSASFIIDSDDPARNMIVWNITLTDGKTRLIYLTLDDETGTIMQMIYRESSVSLYANSSDIQARGYAASSEPDDTLRLSAELICELLTAYYGLPVTLEDYETGGELAYYRADLYTGKNALPLYGVVRKSGFSINERVP